MKWKKERKKEGKEQSRNITKNGIDQLSFVISIVYNVKVLGVGVCLSVCVYCYKIDCNQRNYMKSMIYMTIFKSIHQNSHNICT